MSVQINVGGTLQTPMSVDLSGTGTTDILELTAGDSSPATVIGVSVANDSAGTVECKVFFTEDVTDHLLWVGSLATNVSEKNVLDAPVILFAKETARKIRASGNTGVTVTVIYTRANQQAQQGAR